MRGSKEDLPVAEDYGEGFVSHQVEWGGMIVEISSFPAGVDAAPLFKGLPDDLCQSPHWGYVLKGRVRIRYKDREEVIEAGDVYYLEPGHVPFIEEDSELVEFSPKGEYQRTLEVVERNMAAVQEGQ
jgi:AraC-like ligand binding domain